MTTEQQLIEALEASSSYPPSPDLWRRIVHSIDEDRRHRRRVRTTAGAIAAMLLVFGVIAWLNYEPGVAGSRIEWRIMEAVEVMALAALVVALGPAIRRFGRSYASDLFLSQSSTGDRLLALLDVAYYLVFVGYILMTTRFAPPEVYVESAVGLQIREASIRIGGLLLSMGVLHALALVSLPMIAFVFNSTRTGRKLPRWVVVVLVIATIWLTLNVPAIFTLGLGE
jgi:hypothetical protein